MNTRRVARFAPDTSAAKRLPDARDMNIAAAEADAPVSPPERVVSPPAPVVPEPAAVRRLRPLGPETSSTGASGARRAYARGGANAVEALGGEQKAALHADGAETFEEAFAPRVDDGHAQPVALGPAPTEARPALGAAGGALFVVQLPSAAAPGASGFLRRYASGRVVLELENTPPLDMVDSAASIAAASLASGFGQRQVLVLDEPSLTSLVLGTAAGHAVFTPASDDDLVALLSRGTVQ